MMGRRARWTRKKRVSLSLGRSNSSGVELVLVTITHVTFTVDHVGCSYRFTPVSRYRKMLSDQRIHLDHNKFFLCNICPVVDHGRFAHDCTRPVGTRYRVAPTTIVLMFIFFRAHAPAAIPSLVRKISMSGTGLCYSRYLGVSSGF